MTIGLEANKWWTLAAVLLLFILVFGAFGGALHCGFVHFDDDLYVFNNPLVLAGLSWPGVRWAFTTGHAGNWHPLTWLSLMADTEWCGGRAWGYHATNLVLHALNGALLFLVLRRWTGRFAWPLIAAALWAVHPLRTESVVWISERKDVLAAFFGLLALRAYGRPAVESTRVNAPGYRTSRMALVAVFFALSLMAKPTWVTLPFVLLLVDAWPLGRWPETSAWRLVCEKWPLWVLAALSCAATLHVQHAGGAVQTLAGYPPGLRLANAAVAYVQYVRVCFWPVKLAVFHPYSAAALSATKGILALALLLALTAGAGWTARRRPWWLVGWLWFLGTLVPMIGLVQVGGAAWAERYAYLPQIGLMVALVWGVGIWMEQISWCGEKKIAGLAVLIAVAVLIILSRRQTAVWRSSETLFAHALHVTERNAMAYGALGFAYATEGRNAEAVEHLQRALAIQPDNLRALNNLAWIWATDSEATPRQVEDAVELARRAVEQVRRIWAAGGVPEPGVEAGVLDTLEKAEARQPAVLGGQ